MFFDVEKNGLYANSTSKLLALDPHQVVFGCLGWEIHLQKTTQKIKPITPKEPGIVEAANDHQKFRTVPKIWPNGIIFHKPRFP